MRAESWYPSEVSKIDEEDRQIATSVLGFTWQVFPAAVVNDYDEIFTRLAAEHFDATNIPATPFNLDNLWHICQLGLRHRIPTIGEAAWWAKGGLLLSYGQDASESAAHALEYVDKILRGAKPRDLPVEQETNFELVIKTAETLGLTVPSSLIARADEVIE